MSIINTHVGYNASLANLREEKASRLTMTISKELIRLMFVNYKEMGIDKDNRTLLRIIVSNTVYMSLTGAIGDGWRNHITKTSRFSETFVHQPQNKSSGFWNMFRRKK